MPLLDLQLTLGPTSAKPTDVPLTEMSAVEAAAYATQVLTDVRTALL